MLSLNQIKLYNELCLRTSTYSKTYSGIICPIVTDSNELLSYIKNLFPDFPDHGLQHSFRILNYISYILTDDEIKTLTDTEIFCLIIAALFHDTGMALIESKERNNLRDNHHYKSELVIDRYFDEKLGLINNKDRIKKAILFACKGHGRPIDELYKDIQFEITDNIAFDKVRYSVLAVLLRIGDLMDLEDARSNTFIMSLFKNIYSKESFNHNIRNHNVKYYNYSPEEINIEVVADNIEQHKIWLSWLTYLNDDILRANTYFNDFRFPKLHYKITKADGAEYDVQELRFEIDEKGGIWEIISQSIYTNRLDFLRELLQNAIDASLMKIYNTKSITIDFKSPRSWNTKKDIKDILIGYSEKNNQLYVIDYGIGMSTGDLKNFLFRVSGSGKADSDVRAFEFPSIAKYGIGFISCLVNAKSIKIYTKKTEDVLLHYVSLESNSNLAFMENVASDNFIGTTIVLVLKNKFTFSEIEKYLKDTFKYASVGIRCINIDAVEELSKVLLKSDEFELFKLKPYILGDIYKELNEKRTEIVIPINEESKTLSILCNKIEDLLTWIIDNKEYNSRYSDKQKVRDFKKNISEISDFIVLHNIEHKLPFTKQDVNEKSLLTNQEYTSQIETYYKKIREEYKKTTFKLKKYPYLGDAIYNPSIHSYLNKRYMIAMFNEALEISKIIYTNDPVDLSSGTGILLLNHQMDNYTDGFEYNCVNGFLFHNGEICNSIAEFKRNKLIYKLSDQTETHITGTYYPPEDAWYTLDDVIEEPDLYDCFFDLNVTDEQRNIYQDTYDVVFIENNKFMFNEESMSINIHLYEDNKENEYHLDFVNRIVDFYTKNNVSDENAVYFENIACNLESEYYQDGIKIPFNLECLIPFGYFKIKCNCTADSRMVLNVTRHNTSELPNDVETWMNSTGSKIQESIMCNINDMLKSLNLVVDFQSLNYRHNDSYLASLCKKMLSV